MELAPHKHRAGQRTMSLDQGTRQARVCVECGDVFYTRDHRRVCCSGNCTTAHKRVQNREHYLRAKAKGGKNNGGCHCTPLQYVDDDALAMLESGHRDELIQTFLAKEGMR